MPLDDAYLSAIRGFEGFHTRPYWDVRQWSSGYGTRASGPNEVIDRPEAERRLQTEIGSARNQVRGFGATMTPGQEAALTSLTYNAGPAWMRSGLGSAVRAGDWNGARERFLQYINSGGQPNDGLRNRRNAEAAWLNAPPPVVTPAVAPAADVPPRPNATDNWMGLETRAAPSRVPPPPTPAAPPTPPAQGPSMTQPSSSLLSMFPNFWGGSAPQRPPMGMPSILGAVPNFWGAGLPPRQSFAQPEQPEMPPALGAMPPVEGPPPTIEAPLPITPPNPDAIMAGATAAQAARPPERGFMDKLEGGFMSPLTAAGLQLLFPQSNLAGAMQGAQRAGREQSEYQRQSQQRSVMDRIWSEAFPNGAANMQHPLLQGTNPQVAGLMHAMGAETALPLLARSRMTGGTWEIKDGVMFNSALGPSSAIQVPGGGPAPSGYRRSADGQSLEPIPGGPAEQIAGEIAGRLALMQTARGHYQQARSYFMNNLSAGEAGRHAVGGALLAPQHNMARRTIRLAIEGALRAATGANAPEPEVDRYTEFFTPHVTDPPEVRQQKLNMLEQFMTNAEANATRGRGGPQQGAPASDGFSIRRLP